MLIEPNLLKRFGDQTVDPETLIGGKNALKMKAGRELTNMGIPLNITFSENCALKDNH